MKKRNNFVKVCFLTATLIGCLSFVGCIKEEDLLNNTMKEGTNQAIVKENITLQLSSEGEEIPYELHLLRDQVWKWEQTDNQKTVYIEGDEDFSITNYADYSGNVLKFYQESDGTQSFIYQTEDKNLVYKLVDTPLYTDENAFRNLFVGQKKKTIELSNGIKAYKLSATANVSDLDFIVFPDELESYKDAFTITFENYYDKNTGELLSVQGSYGLDSSVFLAKYEELGEPFGYPISSIEFSKNEISVMFDTHTEQLRQNLDNLIANSKVEAWDEPDYVQNVKDAMNEEGKDGYYLDDGTFSATEPKSKAHSWEQKINGEVVATYDKDTNTYTNKQTGETIADYKADDSELAETVLYVGKDVENKTLSAIWDEIMGIPLNPDKATLMGAEMKEGFLDTEFANNVYAGYYEKTIGQLIDEISFKDRMTSPIYTQNEFYPMIHLAETYNVGIYQADDGSMVTFRDLIILCGYTEEEYNTYKSAYLKWFSEYTVGSIVEEYDEDGELVETR